MLLRLMLPICVLLRVELRMLRLMSTTVCLPWRHRVSICHRIGRSPKSLYHPFFTFDSGWRRAVVRIDCRRVPVLGLQLRVSNSLQRAPLHMDVGAVMWSSRTLLDGTTGLQPLSLTKKHGDQIVAFWMWLVCLTSYTCSCSLQFKITK